MNEAFESHLPSVSLCSGFMSNLLPPSLEWPPLTSLVTKSQVPRGCLQRLSDTIRNVFSLANVTNPEEEGAIDHMVSITTAMRSPAIAVACHTVSYGAPSPFLLSIRVKQNPTCLSLNASQQQAHKG